MQLEQFFKTDHTAKQKESAGLDPGAGNVKRYVVSVGELTLQPAKWCSDHVNAHF